MRGHAPIDLEADGRAEASAPQLGFEGAKQVVGRVVIELEVGGSGDPERVPGQDLHAREEQVEVGGDHLLERHERRRVVGGQEALEQRRHLDPRELRAPVGRVSQPDRQVQREVADVREWMAGVNGQRGEDGEDALDEVRRERRLCGLRDLPPALNPDPRPGQPRLEVAREQLRVARRETRISLGDQVELRRRIQAVDREQTRSGKLLAAQGRDADLVELVEIAGEDGRVLDPLEQRRIGLLGEREDALVEVQRGELAVDIPRLRQASIEFVLNGSCGRGHRWPPA